jgi:F0F1-type ATP synthase membrane subunit c/vacuolar-type H+-ATPase subunit K
MHESTDPAAVRDHASPSMLPPPPPALDPLPSTVQRSLLLGLLVVGIATFGAGLLIEARYGDLVERVGVFLAVYAVLVATSWLPPSVLTQRVDAALEKWVRGSATGYYGMMAFATFTHLEILSLFDAIVDFEPSMSALIEAPLKWLIGFSTESIMNFVWGFAWPGNLFQSRANAIGPGLVVGITWAVFALGAKVLPHASFQGGKRRPKKEKKKP